MKPLILDFAIDRVGKYNPIFEYDSKLSLNIVNTNSGKIPFMDMSDENMVLTTITKVTGEADQENGVSLLEFNTKTRVLQESDDNSSSLLELSTKTLTRTESDD